MRAKLQQAVTLGEGSLFLPPIVRTLLYDTTVLNNSRMLVSCRPGALRADVSRVREGQVRERTPLAQDHRGSSLQVSGHRLYSGNAGTVIGVGLRVGQANRHQCIKCHSAAGRRVVDDALSAPHILCNKFSGRECVRKKSRALGRGAFSKQVDLHQRLNLPPANKHRTRPLFKGWRRQGAPTAKAIIGGSYRNYRRRTPRPRSP
jgi:hypothetical protein